MPPTPFTAAVLHIPFRQLDPADPRGSQRRNAEALVQDLERFATALGTVPRLWVLPVLALTSPYRNMTGIPLADIAVELPGREIFDPLYDFCARHGAWLATSTQERHPAFPGLHFHTGIILGPDGLTLRSPKAQAYSVPGITSLRDITAEYEAAVGEGSVLPVADTPIGRLGILVENEGVVPEAARLLASKGAEIICHPTAVRAVGAPIRAFAQAHAFATGSWWLTGSASRIGPPLKPGQTDEPFGGGAYIADPEGRIVAEVGPDDGIATATVDPGQAAISREKHARETTPAGILYRDLYGENSPAGA